MDNRRSILKKTISSTAALAFFKSGTKTKGHIILPSLSDNTSVSIMSGEKEIDRQPVSLKFSKKGISNANHLRFVSSIGSYQATRIKWNYGNETWHETQIDIFVHKDLDATIEPGNLVILFHNMDSEPEIHYLVED